MMQQTTRLLVPVILAFTATTGFAQTPEEQFKALLEQYEDEGGSEVFAGRFLELARAHASDPVALDALEWVLAQRRSHPEALQAIQLLGEQHLQSPRLLEICRVVASVPARPAERWLRTVLQESDHRAIRAEACLRLAEFLEREASILAQLDGNSELRGRVREYYGEEYGGHLLATSPADSRAALERVYVQLGEQFGELVRDEEPLGNLAERSLFRIRNLSIGCEAPEIKGEDLDGKQFRLSDYRGQVVLLSFWGHW